MESLLKNAFKKQIESREGIAFEEFIDELFLLLHGRDSYLPIRRTGDKGNDGTILSEAKILACYAPRKYDEKNFIKKVKGDTKKAGDYQKYLDNWQNTYPNWEMIVNHEIAPAELKLIDKLEGNTSIKGVDQLLSIIENELSSSKRRKLAKFLGIDDFFIQDSLNEILNDLLNDSIESNIDIEYESPIYIEEKVKLNYEQEDVDGVLSEYDLLMTHFPEISSLLSGYSFSEVSTLKFRIINDFNNLSGDFKKRFNNLCTSYTEKYGKISDDEYRKSVKIILMYMFEQCLIGVKTEEEKAC